MPSLRTHHLATIATLAALVAAAACATDVALPRVEPELPAGRRSLLGDLASAVRDAAWPGDSGAVSTDAGRRLMEADGAALGRAASGRSLTVTATTAAVLRLVSGNASAAPSGLALSQPIAPLDACLVWRRRPSGPGGATRDGMYFLAVFHSSVWSVLLLCLICTVALLTLLEAAHPIGMPRSLLEARRHRRRHLVEKPMGAFHTLAFAAGALLLVGYPRGPKATSGRVMALFWWLFAFAVAAAYLSATVLTFLTTRSAQPAAPNATLADVLRSTPAGGRTVLCSAGNPLCADWARPEPLARANFTPVASDNAGLQQLQSGSADLLLLTHQFACANLLAADTNRSYSLATVARAAAWVSLAGPADLIRLADEHVLSLLGSGRLARLATLHGLDANSDSSGKSGAEGCGISDWLSELRHALPYRVDSMYGPLLLLVVGFGLALVTAACEFCYYRFFIDVEEEVQLEAEIERKERAATIASTMETYL